MDPSNHKTLLISSKDVEQIVIKIGLNTTMDKLIQNMNAYFLDYDSEKIKITAKQCLTSLLSACIHFALPNSDIFILLFRMPATSKLQAISSIFSWSFLLCLARRHVLEEGE